MLDHAEPTPYEVPVLRYWHTTNKGNHVYHVAAELPDGLGKVAPVWLASRIPVHHCLSETSAAATALVF